MPTWALALLVIIALGGAVWLFVAEQSSDDPEPAQPTAAERSGEKPRAKGVLEIADEDEQPTSRRGTDAEDADESEADAPIDPTLPSAFVHLRDRTVVLAVASAGAAADADPKARVKTGGLTLPCVSGVDLTRVTRELAFVAALRRVLDRAGADIQVKIDEQGAAPCVDDRVAAMEQADFALVVRAGDTAAGRVFAARAAGSLDEDDRRASIALAAEVAATLKLKSVTPGTAKADRSMLAGAGALDVDPTGATMLLELRADLVAEDVDEASLDAAAFEVARGMAAAASAAQASR